jgi:hypothetical protein
MTVTYRFKLSSNKMINEVEQIQDMQQQNQALELQHTKLQKKYQKLQKKHQKTCMFLKEII